jgi:aspartate carbamoyltransferase catalytic subunit
VQDQYFGRSLLSTHDLNASDILSLFESALALERLNPPKRRLKALGTVGLMAFFEPSTRTRLSFEKAGLDLGMSWIHFGAQGSSLEKGESEEDSLRVLSLYEPHLTVLRHAESGFASVAARWMNAPVINAGDGMHEHPSQALGDAYLLWKKQPKKKWRIAMVGDVASSRVARSLANVCRALGYSLSVVGQDATSRKFAHAYQLETNKRSALQKAEIVYVLRAQRERGSAAAAATVGMNELGPKSLVMHPGPVMWGTDLSLSCRLHLAERNLILDQAAACYQMRRALLMRALGP